MVVCAFWRSHLACDVFCFAAWYSFIVRLFLCYLVHCKWPCTRYIFWWTLCNPLTIFDPYTHLYAKCCCDLWDNLLHKMHHVWAKWSWGHFCFWTALSEFDLSSVCILWITFKCQCQYIIKVFFVKIINVITIWSIFFSIVWKQSGGRSISRKGCAHLRLSRVHQVIDKRYDIVRFEAFGKSQNFCRKTCKIFENP